MQPCPPPLPLPPSLSLPLSVWGSDLLSNTVNECAYKNINFPPELMHCANASRCCVKTLCDIRRCELVRCKWIEQLGANTAAHLPVQTLTLLHSTCKWDTHTSTQCWALCLQDANSCFWHNTETSVETHSNYHTPPLDPREGKASLIETPTAVEEVGCTHAFTAWRLVVVTQLEVQGLGNQQLRRCHGDYIFDYKKNGSI